MMRIAIGVILIALLITKGSTGLPDNKLVVTALATPTVHNEDQDQYKSFRAGRGGFRSPRSGYNGGIRNQRPNNPVTRTPAAPTRRFGGFFGGVLAGTFLGGLLNPFGFGGSGGFSLFGLLFWGFILFFVIRFLRRRFGGGIR